MKKIMFVVAVLLFLSSPVYSAGKECYVADGWVNEAWAGSQFWLDGDCACAIGEAFGNESLTEYTKQAIKSAHQRLSVGLGETKKEQKVKIIGTYGRSGRVFVLLYACPLEK